MKKRTFSLLLVCVCFHLGGSAQQESSTTRQAQDLLNIRIEISESQTHFLEVLQRLAYIHKVPIGVELSMTYRQRQFEGMKIENDRLTWNDKLEVRAGKLEEILNQLVRQEPEYTWEINDGVVNVYPVMDRDLLIERILKVKVKETVRKHKFDRSNLVDLISEVGEFGSLLNSSNVEFKRDDSLNQVFNYENTEINGFEVKATDVKGLLNKFVRLSNQKIWIIERTGENKKILSINF